MPIKKLTISLWVKRLPFWLSILSLVLVAYDVGFNQPDKGQQVLFNLYCVVLTTGITSLTVRFFLKSYRPRPKVIPFDILLILYLLMQIAVFYGWIELSLFDHAAWMYIALGLVFIREFSALRINLYTQSLNPAQLFTGSFFGIIILGTLLLLLPNATNGNLGLVNALFTSTSAVCVTGLAVVDTGTFFTIYGQIIILALIQIGGIGIMTFTSYFSYFFKAESSYRDNLILKDMMNLERISDVLGTLKRIILITFLIELLGAFLLFPTLDPAVVPETDRRIFFSIFHSVSAFCNAGFSTVSEGLYNSGFRFNYPMHLVLSGLIILGGLGFPIVFNFIQYIRHLIVHRIILFRRRRKPVHKPWVISINTRIVLITTGLLLLAGTLLYFFFEYNNALAEHHGLGKLVTAFFGAVTPRTAGYNTLNIGSLHVTTLLLTLFLMWVGASPGSTGGGIKTSTLALMVVNVFSLARGKDRIEVFGREISGVSVRRSYAMVGLSLLSVGLSVFFISALEPEKTLLPVLFESISAFSTVGLSMGITGDLCDGSKLVLILTMFIGRVGMLTVLSAFIRKLKHLNYLYPKEDILIN